MIPKAVLIIKSVMLCVVDARNSMGMALAICIKSNKSHRLDDRGENKENLKSFIPRSSET